jgi:AcrR family transcriptional regulator
LRVIEAIRFAYDGHPYNELRSFFRIDSMSQRTPPRHTRPRKAPRQARSEETVASIVEAAAQVLETEGFEGFNTNAVARRAGVSIGSLYQYFPGKDALTVALIHRETARFHADAAVALNQRSGKAALEFLIGAAVRQQLQRPMLARLLDLEEARPGLRGAVKTSELEAVFIDVIRRAAPKHARPDIAAGDVTAIIRGMTDSAGERGERDIDDLERRLRAAVFGYLSRTAKDE